MAWFLFVDESGHDHQASPYEVLAGVAVEDQHLWSLVSAVHRAEQAFFGMRISSGPLELKAKKLLKRKTFVQAAQMPPFEADERRRLALACHSRREELADLASAVCKLRYLAYRKRDGQLFNVWSFAYIDDLRPREEREPDVRAQKKAMQAEPDKASTQ